MNMYISLKPPDFSWKNCFQAFGSRIHWFEKRAFLRASKSSHGVTLPELMLTVAILGILSAVLVPKFADQIRKSAEAHTKGTLATLRSALLIYFADNIGVDVSTLSALTPKYIDELPTAKIGKYHSDTNSDVSATTFGVAGITDLGGWYYVTPSGTLYVNCTHTDTKGQYITNW